MEGAKLDSKLLGSRRSGSESVEDSLRPFVFPVSQYQHCHRRPVWGVLGVHDYFLAQKACMERLSQHISDSGPICLKSSYHELLQRSWLVIVKKSKS